MIRNRSCCTYDRFLREQIAGDELVPYADEHIIATGFLAAARNNNNEEDKAVQLNEPLVNIANTTASVALGLTLGCAQCHDHKFEPLTLRDYYSWHGLFVRGQVNSLLLKNPELVDAWEKSRPPEIDTAKKLLAELTGPVRAKLRDEARTKLSAERCAALAVSADARTPEQIELAKRAEKALEVPDGAVKKALDDDDQKLLAELKKKVAALEKKLAESRPQTWGYFSPATSPHAVEHLPPRGMNPFPYKPAALKDAKAVVLKRGNVAMRGEPVEAAVPSILGGAKLNTRRELADWLASDANPLTARVWVNFVWQQHFGRGLVETPGDFGLKGARATNQPLLDWLASELRARGWSTKHLHHLIVTSAAYRRASAGSNQYSVISNQLAKAGASVPAVNTVSLITDYSASQRIDPDNRYLWRWVPRRLEAEAIRDSMLAVAGKLDFTVGGPSEAPDQPSHRRSFYLLQRRFQLPEGQALFDAPVANESCPRRHSSTVPLQPLHLLNNETNVKLAASLASRVRALARDDRARQADAAFRLALGRDPDDAERAAAEAFFSRHSAIQKGEASHDALVDFCQAIMNLNEFLYLP